MDLTVLPQDHYLTLSNILCMSILQVSGASLLLCLFARLLLCSYTELYTPGITIHLWGSLLASSLLQKDVSSSISLVHTTGFIPANHNTLFVASLTVRADSGHSAHQGEPARCC